jgi:hypothetical protein
MFYELIESGERRFIVPRGKQTFLEPASKPLKGDSNEGKY